MKTPRKRPMQASLVAGLLLTFAPAPPTSAEETIKVTEEKVVVKSEDGKAEIKANGAVTVKGSGGEEALRTANRVLAEKEAAELRARLVEGYVVPLEQNHFLVPVPEETLRNHQNHRPGLVYRSLGDRLYGLDPATNAVIHILDAPPSTVVVGKVSTANAATTPTHASAERLTLLGTELGVREIPAGTYLILEADVLFDFDSATIRESAVPTLRKVGELIRLSGDRNVEVAGFTDAVGGNGYNLKLSLERANAVIAWLVRHEILPPTRFHPFGMGEAGAVAPNWLPDGTDNPVGRQFNRRVEILIRK